MISIFLNYASIILYYLDTTDFLFIKLLDQSSRNCVLRAVYSDCILKGLEAVSSCFVYKYNICLQIHALEIFNTALGYASCSIENFSFIVWPARACICNYNIDRSLRAL